MTVRVAIIGTGYVGLVAGAGLAELGATVSCIDIDKAKISQLNSAQIPFYEPGLEDLVKENIRSGRLKFSSSIEDVIPNQNIVFLAVGTPSLPNGGADLSALFAAARAVFRAAQDNLVVVCKSTVPVGTAARLRSLAKEVSSRQIFIASNPEFLKEGDAVNDFLKPERIIIGVDDGFAQEALESLYRPLMLRQRRLIVMDSNSAEMTKYAANAMLATRISFMNEVANLCEAVGADIDMVRQGIGSDSRIGNKFLYPGVGWGGSCFGKDCKALIEMGQNNGMYMGIVDAANTANEIQKWKIFRKIEKKYKQLDNLTIAVWGLAFKPRTDDIRDAPAVDLLEQLLAAGARVKAYDRAATRNVKAKFPPDQYPNLVLAEDEYAAVDGADILVLMTEWPEFRLPDWEDIKRRMRGNDVYDGRNIWDFETISKAGFEYNGIGKRNSLH